MSIDNVTALDDARKRKKGGRMDGGETLDGKPVIRLAMGDDARHVDEAEQALILLDDGVYRYGQRIVRVVWDRIKVAGGGDGNVLRLSNITAPHLFERFGVAARFERWDVRGGDWVVTKCPAELPAIYLARDGAWKLPPILGVVTTPTLRSDGSVLDEPGYDEATGIVFNPLGISFPPVPDRPTKEDAAVALDFLKGPLRTFPFAQGGNLAVALSSILTTLVRRSLPSAPMHAFTAPTAGSGKSLLVDIASVVATGERASVTSIGKNDEETEKRLGASMLSGDNVISLDNLEVPLNGELLCQALTQPSVRVRVLGYSERKEIPSTTSFFATGNNLTVVGDLTRRVLVSRLDVEDERPELRQFAFDPVDMVKADRSEYVRAALTIMRAYVLSDDKVELPPLGSFREWSRMVREPLVWLGEVDPVDVLEEVRRNDPRLLLLNQMISAWSTVFGDQPTKVREVVREATVKDEDRYLNPELHDAVEAAVRGKQINGESVSWWLRRNVGKTVAGMRFERGEEVRGLALWTLKGAAPLVADDGIEPSTDIPFY